MIIDVLSLIAYAGLAFVATIGVMAFWHVARYRPRQNYRGNKRA